MQVQIKLDFTFFRIYVNVNFRRTSSCSLYNQSEFSEAFSNMSSVFDRRAQDAVAAALENNIVLREIFSCLTLNDLKQCRLVKRSWNSEASSFIRDFRLCNARIGKGTPCSGLTGLAEVVSGMHTVPINSLSVYLHGSGHSDCQPIPANILTNLMETLPLQGFEVFWEPNFRTLNCAAIHFVTDLLRRKIMELSTLEFTQLPDHFLTYFGQAWAPWLPKLKVLGMQALESYPRLPSTSELFLKIINGAPNLKKIRGDVDSLTLNMIPEDKYYLVDYVSLSAESNREIEIWSRLAQAQPVLSELYITAPYIESMLQHMGSYLDSLEKILGSSCKSLKSITMASPIFFLDRLNFPPLINVQNIRFSADETIPHILHILRSIDYPRLFPALYKVDVDMDSEPDFPFENPWEDVDAAEVVQLHPSTTVKHLKVSADFNSLTFKELSQIFPNAVHLDFDLQQPLEDPAGATSHIDLWAAWPYLESVYLCESREAVRLNFDADFLGISTEEVEILRQFDDESLEKMNIVPTRPSVLTLLRLNGMKITFSRDYRPAEGDMDRCFLSKVTGILAFRKMAKQGVKIEFMCKDAQTALRLNHLAPFVSLGSGF